MRDLFWSANFFPGTYHNTQLFGNIFGGLFTLKSPVTHHPEVLGSVQATAGGQINFLATFRWIKRGGGEGYGFQKFTKRWLTKATKIHLKKGILKACCSPQTHIWFNKSVICFVVLQRWSKLYWKNWIRKLPAVSRMSLARVFIMLNGVVVLLIYYSLRIQVLVKEGITPIESYFEDRIANTSILFINTCYFGFLIIPFYSKHIPINKIRRTILPTHPNKSTNLKNQPLRTPSKRKHI